MNEKNLPNNPTLDDIKELLNKINSNVNTLNASINGEVLVFNSSSTSIIN